MSMYNASLVAGFLVRDGASYLKTNVLAIEGLVQGMREYRIEYVENDSVDATRRILNALEARDARFRGIRLDGLGNHSTALCAPNTPNCAKRTSLLASLRQRLLTRMLRFSSDLLLMIDIDFASFSFHDAWHLFRDMNDSPSLEAVFGMSVVRGSCLLGYDTGAIGDAWTREYETTMASISACRPTSVTSAFSGFGLYRTARVRARGARYVGDGRIEHRHFNEFFDELRVTPLFRPKYNGSFAEYRYPMRCSTSDCQAETTTARWTQVAVVCVLVYALLLTARVVWRSTVVAKCMQYDGAHAFAPVVVWALMYSAASNCMMLGNKILATRERVDACVECLPSEALALVATQMVVALLPCALACARVGLGNRTHLLWWTLTVPMPFAGMLVTSILALRDASLGAFVVGRNAAPILTLVYDARMRTPDRQPVTAQLLGSLTCILVGVGLYSWSDMYSSPTGFAYIGANVVCTSAEHLLVRRWMTHRRLDLTKSAMLLVNNGVGALVVTPFAIGLARGTYMRGTWQNGTILVVTSLLGVALGFVGLKAQSLMTSTAFLLLSNANKAAIVMIGIVFWNESHTATSMLGCVLALLGSMWYAMRPPLDKKNESAASAVDDVQLE